MKARTKYYKVTLVTHSNTQGDEAKRCKTMPDGWRVCTWIRWTIAEAKALRDALPGSVLSCWDSGLLWRVP